MTPGPRHRRRGFTLLEMSSYIMLFAIVAACTQATMAALLRGSRQGAATDHGVLVDVVCDVLRRDCARGASFDGSGLLAGDARWDVADGWLRRDGAHRLSSCAAHWERSGDGAVTITIIPHLGLARVIRAEPRSGWEGRP